MADVRVPVLIVGAGAGGLATAALLAKHGVPSLVVEKRREVFRYPKARNLSFRSLEILRGLGLANEIHAVADGVSDMVVKPTLSSTDERPAMDMDAIFAGLEPLSPEPAAQYCPQSRLEPILLQHIRHHGSSARYGVELTSLTQDEAGVTAMVRDLDSGHSQDVRADYLVAADGVHSGIRTTLGVNHRVWGAADLHRVHVLPCAVSLTHSPPGRGSGSPGHQLRRRRDLRCSRGRPRHVHHDLSPQRPADGRAIHRTAVPGDDPLRHRTISAR